MKIYHYYHDTKEYYREEEYVAAPGTGLPRYSTEQKPIETDGDLKNIFEDGKWVLKEDHRGKSVYHTQTGEFFVVNGLGEINPILTFEKPNTPFDEFIDGKWVYSAEKEKNLRAEARAHEAEGTLDRLNHEKDIIEGLMKNGGASKIEIKHLKAIKKFIPLISRNMLIGVDIPEAPVYPKILDGKPISQKIKAFFGV